MNRLPSDLFERFNKQLSDYFGLFDDKPRYRIVFSEDIIEKRWTKFTDEGFELINPEVRDLPKYRQWVQAKYILEQLTALDKFTDTGLVTEISYEPVWVFEDKSGNGLPPNFVVCKYVIDTIYENMVKAGLYKKYDDPRENMTLEERELELKEIERALFANETDTGDALAYKEGIVVPSNYNKTTH